MPYFSYQDYVGLDVLETTVRFLPAGIVGGESQQLPIIALSCR